MPPPTANDARAHRIEHLIKLRDNLSPPCKTIVLTGSPDESERLAFIFHGIDAYIAKDDVEIILLRQIIESNSARRSHERLQYETYITSMSTAESIGHAVGQGIYTEQSVAQSLQVETETVKKYVTRARKKVLRFADTSTD